MKVSPHKKRLQIAVSLLSELTKSPQPPNRQEVVDMLREAYERSKLQPIRGTSLPPDIYDKEMSTLYVVGKYGLLLHEEYPKLFAEIFYKEEAYERALELIAGGNYEEARKILKESSASGYIDSNTVARMLRIPLTRLILGFMAEEEFAKILHAVSEAIPEERKTVENYTRFFIAFKVAEGIYRGEIKNKGYKEAVKKALAIRLGFPRSVPSDNYIEAIAESVFGISPEVLSKVLKAKEEREGGDSTEQDRGPSPSASQ